MNTYKLILKRPSVRNFKDQPIPEELVDKLLDAANNAPGNNRQRCVALGDRHDFLWKDIVPRKK